MNNSHYIQHAEHLATPLPLPIRERRGFIAAKYRVQAGVRDRFKMDIAGTGHYCPGDAYRYIKTRLKLKGG